MQVYDQFPPNTRLTLLSMKPLEPGGGGVEGCRREGHLTSLTATSDEAVSVIDLEDFHNWEGY